MHVAFQTSLRNDLECGHSLSRPFLSWIRLTALFQEDSDAASLAFWVDWMPLRIKTDASTPFEPWFLAFVRRPKQDIILAQATCGVVPPVKKGGGKPDNSIISVWLLSPQAHLTWHEAAQAPSHPGCSTIYSVFISFVWDSEKKGGFISKLNFSVTCPYKSNYMKV